MQKNFSLAAEKQGSEAVNCRCELYTYKGIYYNYVYISGFFIREEQKIP